MPEYVMYRPVQTSLLESFLEIIGSMVKYFLVGLASFKFLLVTKCSESSILSTTFLMVKFCPNESELMIKNNGINCKGFMFYGFEPRKVQIFSYFNCYYSSFRYRSFPNYLKFAVI